MAQIRSPLWRFLGFIVQGDLGPLTFWTSPSKGMVAILSAPPDKPWTHWQRSNRNKWHLALTAWNELLPETRARWEAAARGARCRCTGLNLWVSQWCRPDRNVIPTIQRQSGVNLQ
jgi:hypothetical protein